MLNQSFGPIPPIPPLDVCQTKILDNFQKVFWDSGHFLQQYGLFDNCKADNLSYSLSLIYNHTHGPANPPIYTGIYMGLCLPQQCSEPFIKATINGLLAQLGKSTKGFYVQQVVHNPQDYQFQKKWLFYPVIVLIMLLILLTIISTILNRSAKYRDHPSLSMKILGSFNLGESFKIFKYKHNVFNVFNGIKTICMFWVVLGHQYSERLHNNINAADMAVQIQTWFFLFVIAAFFAVDVFFFLGGFLVAYSFLRQTSRNPLKYPIAVVHRILRFWPSYLMTILIFYAVFLQTGSGIFWFSNDATQTVDNCADLWKPMFFVDNLVDNGQKMCMGWGWYLQNDMQIFIFSMIFLFGYSKNKKISKIAILLLSLGSLVLNFVQVQVGGYIQVTHRQDFAKWGEYFPNIYIKPWTRCPPYLIGLFFGMQYMEYLGIKKKREQMEHQQHSKLLNRTSLNEDSSLLEQKKELPGHYMINLKQKMMKNKYLIHLFQIIGLALMLFVVLIPRTLQVDYKWPQFVHSLYLSTGKVFFVLGMYIMILPSLLDIPNITFFVMDTKFFNIVSKVSFWTYLIHYMVVLQITFGQKIDFYYSVGDILPLYIPTAAISVFFGFMGTILVQIPFAKMQKMLMNTLMGKKDTSRNVAKVGSITQPLTQSLKQSTMSQKLQSSTIIQNENSIITTTEGSKQK